MINTEEMRLFIIVMFLFGTLNLSAQITATNFNVTDCDGNPYELYAELDAGKVIVICWVMPCGPCGPPALTAYNVTQSFASTHPGRVQMYVCDDFANTNCASINGWANTIGLTNTIRFSDPAIDMFDYGQYGMPKVVVMGGPGRYRVYDDQTDVFDHVQLQNAIQLALSEATSVSEPDPAPQIRLYPNPVADGHFMIDHDINDVIKVSVINNYGQVLFEIADQQVIPGSPLKINSSGLASGMYMVVIEGSLSKSIHRIIII